MQGERDDGGQHRGAKRLQQHVSQHIFRRRAGDDQSRPAERAPNAASKSSRDQREQHPGQQRHAGERNLRDNQGLRRAGQDLLRENAPEPVAGIDPCPGAGKIGAAQRKRHDVMAEEPRQIGGGRTAAGTSREPEQAGDQQQRQCRRTRPQPPRCNEPVKAEQQRRRLRVAALFEKTVEIEANGRQADEAEHQRGAQPAFESVQSVVAERFEQRRQLCEGKDRNARRAGWQRMRRGQVRLLDHFRIDFGENAGIRQRA